LRADRNVCISQCSSNACYVGTETHEGCPFNNAGPRLHSNRLCNLCAKCVKNCPHGAMTLSLRMPGREIWESRRHKQGTAFLVLGLLAGLISEMICRIPIGEQLKAVLPLGEMGRFTVIFVAFIAVVNICFALAVGISRRTSGEPFRENYARYGLALLPLALLGYFAFHLYFLLKIGVQLPILVKEKFDFAVFDRLMFQAPLHLVHIAQVVLVLAGLAWSLMVIYRLGRSDHEEIGKAVAGVAPHACLATIMGLILIKAIGAYFYG
ncbi:MAG: DNA-binding protein, partial [Deltaproteobacteria bacterium]|nr:DNA-binding protein [Deltaproteobacteria bacterium]